MKIEIEITEAEIRNAIERKVRVAIADQTNSLYSDSYIREQVKASWKAAVDALVVEQLKDSKVLREKIRAEIERKLRSQVTAAMRAIT